MQPRDRDGIVWVDGGAGSGCMACLIACAGDVPQWDSRADLHRGPSTMGVITISRGTKTGGTLLAEKVAERLGAKVISREELVAVDPVLKATESELRQELKDRPPYLYDTLDSLRLAYTCTLRASLVEHAAQGPIVVHGNGAQFLLQDLPGLLRVRVVAPMHLRLEMVREARGGSKLDASRYIYDKDQGRLTLTRFLYGVESLADPLYFDLVVNLESMSIDQAADLVQAAAEMEPFKWDDTHPVELANMRVATRVKAVLLQNPNLRMALPEVSAADGAVFIYTDPETDILAEELTRVASSVPGVNQVEVVFDSPPDSDTPRF